MLISCKEESRKLLLRESIKELCPVSTVASPLTSITEKEFGSCNILCEVSSLNHCHQQMSFLHWEWILLNWWNKVLCSWMAIIYLEDCYRYWKICFPPPPTSCKLWYLAAGPMEQNTQKGKSGQASDMPGVKCETCLTNTETHKMRDLLIVLLHTFEIIHITELLILDCARYLGAGKEEGLNSTDFEIWVSRSELLDNCHREHPEVSISLMSAVWRFSH